MKKKTETSVKDLDKNEEVERLVMLRRDALIMANARQIIKAPKSTLNWVLAMRLFGLGSTSGTILCEKLGIDPESSETNFSEMMRHLKA